MRKKLLNTIIFATSLIVINANATPRDNGFYTGIDLGFISSIGGDSGSEGITNKPALTIKIGYQHLKKNRISFYARNNDFYKGYGTISNTFGINYEFGIPLLSASSNKVLPYISIGMGKGINRTADEVEASFGVHYKINKHFDTTFGFQHKLITFSSSDFLSYHEDITTKAIDVGVTYHF